MNTVAALVVSTVVAFAAGPASAEDTQGRMVGEVRALALAPHSAAVDNLHHQGWIEARGQLLDAHKFTELFNAIGRTWTSPDAPEGEFAIPDIHDRTQRVISADNPYGVLGPGDLVTSTPASKDWIRAYPISYWIYTGKDVTMVTQGVVR